MWCTRWYLPLVLLPMPTAPPYFLLLFLFSTTMYARPCFYCMVLLTAMFMSTCYWPPVPIETPLVRPWSENVTTFADALHLLMPNLPEEKVPSTIPIADRCWCDLSNGFFTSFNTTKWEELSVVRLKGSLEKAMATEKREGEEQMCETAEGEVAEPETAVCSASEEASNVTISTPLTTSQGRKLLWDMFRALRRKSNRGSSIPSTNDTVLPEPVKLESPPAPEPSTSRSNHEHPTIQLPWLRREYDLRRFGFAMVLDLRWPSSRL